MSGLDMFLNVPSWAYDFCYYYFAVAAIVALYTIYALFELFMMPNAVKRFVPMATMAIALILSGIVSGVLALMQFWVCRSALKGTTGKEKFAVKCDKEEDCTAVMGTPQKSGLCSCGGRGLCGGCVMQNNMEPAMLPEYNEGYASIAEGFRSSRY
jgi:hypothetical protein